jgi:7,8-dihydropterin-6-yl-methyl-4-(beta-D-ribofuranosyl)aminobenzene 5'-phosphate synthase
MNSLRSLKITTLAENFVQKRGLGQWGLSFLLHIEDAKGKEKKIVFDTGANKKALFHNAKILKEDFRDINCIVLSHGHGDHTAATTELVSISGGVTVYGHPHTFLSRIIEEKDGKKKRVSPRKGQNISDIESAGGKVVLSVSPVEVVPGLYTTGQVERKTSYEVISPPPSGGKRIIAVSGKETNDQILDDLSLWANVTGTGIWVITGCTHSGPINTLTQVQRLSTQKEIFGMIGGTHLVRRTDEYVNKTIEDLGKFNLQLISPCHCTGFKATAKLWQAFPNEFILNYNLRIIKAGEKITERII